MRGKGNGTVFWFWTLLALVCLQLLGPRFPLVTFPSVLILATIIAYVSQGSWRFLLALALVGELFSLLPPGILAVAIFIPWLLTRVPGRPSADFSILFGCWLLLTATVQVGILTIGLWWQALASMTLPLWHSWWPYVPAFAPLTILSLTLLPMAAIVIWLERVAPHQVQRTVPRFKGK